MPQQARLIGMSGTTMTESSTPKFQEDPRDTRLLIVTAARTVLARDGAGAMTLDAVADEAEMSVEEVMSHFADTHELVTAIAADDLAALSRAKRQEAPKESHDNDAMMRHEQRLAALEASIADMFERHEKSLKERAGVVSWVEQSVNTLRQRLEMSEHQHAGVIAELRAALAYTPHQHHEAPPAPAMTESHPGVMPPPMPDFPPMSFTADPHELPPVATNSPSKDSATTDTSAMDSYLSAARRAAIDAQQGEHDKRKANQEQKGNRTKYLISACIAGLVIPAVATFVLNRHVVTATTMSPPPAQVSAEIPSVVVTPAKPALTPPPQVTMMPPTDPTPAQLGQTQSIEKLTEMANADDMQAERDLGLKYLAGDGVDANEAEAARWLMRAAYKGEPTAEYWLGTLYARGHGVPADAFQANHWYEAAAKQGNRRAMHSFAVAYFQGWGVEKNFAEAARWFRNAAELGFVDSEFNLAVLYERGAGVQQSLSDAYKWYAIAAKAGDMEADARVAAIATQLAPGDLALAQQAAASFKPTPMNESANINSATTQPSGG